MTQVAVVGMACRYPKAHDVRQFWANLRAGVEGISHFSRDELVARGVAAELAHRPEFVPAKGFLAGSGAFDWAFFGYSRAEAAGIDPQQRVFLECAAAAIDDAGMDPTRFPGWIGVYAGADVVGLAPDTGRGELAHVIGTEKDFLATRVAYKLGLRGPAVTVQTACSTSLTATHMAVKSLLGYECDAALAGGVTVTAKGEWGYLYEAGGILSPDGHCRPFDEQAGGTVPSEGVGVVVLKRLEDALRDGDRIAAVILGSAINNDGADKMGYTAPSIPGQSEVIGYAQQVAGIDPADVDYVEAHGTATRIGDPVEVQALTDVFHAGSDRTGWCLLGAVKSNIGHTGAAAGVAGLIKTTLMLEHREVVPSLHYASPNPMLDIGSTPFRVATATAPWPDRGVPLAAVSSFGVGGTNAHVIVRAAPERTRSAGSGHWILPLSAATGEALDSLGRDLASAAHPVPAMARTLAGRRALRHRRAVVDTHTLDQPRDTRPGSLDRVVFLFPGQGTLRSAAGAVPYRMLSGFRTAFDTIAEMSTVDLTPVVAGGSPDWFEHTVHQQLGLFALGYALGRQLADWGVRPRAMFGNSVGEYTAATLAGVWTPEVAVNLVRERATAMWDTEPGLMVTVNAPLDVVLDRIGDEISVAVAGPGRTVVSGSVVAVEKLLAGDALHGLDVRPLATNRAFHTPAMAPAAGVLRAAVAAAGNARPRVRLVSNETGTWADPDAVGGPDYWAGQLLHRVDLTAGAGTVLADHDTFVELGPGASMISTLRRHASWRPDGVTIPMLGSSDDPELDLLRAVGRLWECGADQALTGLVPDATVTRVSLPSAPFAATDPAGPTVEARTVTRANGVLADLWCATLGVAAAVESDDFFALGGESLLVVSLLRQVRERTGRDVSITEFSARATYGDLVRLVGPHRTERPAGVVVLHEDGPKPPLFLVADAMGTTLAYSRLASLLDRPVYGLEPTGDVHSVERLAVQHADQIQGIAPAGPYTLGGWSFGAIVAHETARQLTLRGQRIDLLVCLDGYVPATGRPIGLDRGYLVGSTWAQASALLGIGPVGRRTRRTPEIRRRFVRNITSMLRYRPEPVDCPAVVFTVDPRAHPAAAVVHHVGGDHWSMLTEPHVHDLATRLRAALPPEQPSTQERRT